jgi:O-antigen/teichoic acid export membrane protein
MSSTKNIALSTFWQILSQALMALMSAVSVKCVALGLERELAGAYNSAYGYLQLFAILADFGLYAVSVREVSIAKDKSRVLGSLLVLRTIATILSLGAAVGIVWLVPAWEGSPLRIGISIAALVPFFTLLAGVLRSIFQVEYKMHFVFIAEIAQRILTTGAMLLIIWSGVRLSQDPKTYEAFLWIGSLGAAVLFMLSLFFALRISTVRPCFDPTLLKKLFLKAAPYGLAYLCIALYRQFDLTMIALLRPDFANLNALYGFASRITEMTYIVPTFLLNSTLPILSARHENRQPVDSLLGKTLLAVLILGSVAATFSFFWSRPIMLLLTTTDYVTPLSSPGADTALRLLSAPQFLNGIVLFSFYVLLTRHAWKTLVLHMGIAAALSISLNLWLIPAYGFVGAISTLTVVHLFLAVTLFSAAQRALRTSFPWKTGLLWGGFFLCIAVGAAVSAPYITTTVSTLIGLTTACIMLVVLAYLFRFHRLLRWNADAPQPDAGMEIAV